jgi:acid phosphatase family membrane protein YuiD
VLRNHLSRRESHTTHPGERPIALGHGLLSVRSAVIFAIATAAGLLVGWSQPGLGLGAWLALVVGLDAIIDRDQPHSR